MKIVNKQQLNVLMMNCLFDLEESHDEFAKWWIDRLEGDERLAFIAQLSELLANRLDIDD